jgi:hypothetical protein
MEDLHIPCILWFQGDPPADPTDFADPIRIPFTIRRRPEPPTPTGAPRSNLPDADSSRHAMGCGPAIMVSQSTGHLSPNAVTNIRLATVRVR